MLLPAVQLDLVAPSPLGYAPRMSTPASPPASQGRETRLLLVTIAVSVGVLLLLARFRFPAESVDRPVESAPAPLERLAAEATYEELASIMADLERRLAPRVEVMRTKVPDGTESFVVAPRIAPDRGIALTPGDSSVERTGQPGDVEIVGHDAASGVSVLRVPAVDDGAVTIRTAAPRPGPRYVGVLDATPHGAILRPVYVGRMQLAPDAPTGAQQLALVTPSGPLARGAAIFALDGAFLGLVRDSGDTTVVLTGDYLRTAARSAPPVASGPRGSLGVELDPLTPGLMRATGADRGVAIAHVRPAGPGEKVLQSGDVVQSLDGTAVASVPDFRQIEATRGPGATVAVAGIRRGVPFNVKVTAEDATAGSAPRSDPDHGVVGRDLPGAGLEVVAIAAASPAAAAGLKPGDLIVRLDGRPVPTRAALADRYRAAAAESALLLTVQRGGRHHVLGLDKR